MLLKICCYWKFLNYYLWKKITSIEYWMRYIYLLSVLIFLNIVSLDTFKSTWRRRHWGAFWKVLQNSVRRIAHRYSKINTLKQQVSARIIVFPIHRYPLRIDKFFTSFLLFCPQKIQTHWISPCKLGRQSR